MESFLFIHFLVVLYFSQVSYYIFIWADAEILGLLLYDAFREVNVFICRTHVVPSLDFCSTVSSVLFADPYLVYICFFAIVALSQTQWTSSNFSVVHFCCIMRNSFALHISSLYHTFLVMFLVSFFPWEKSTKSFWGSTSRKGCLHSRHAILSCSSLATAALSSWLYRTLSCCLMVTWSQRSYLSMCPSTCFPHSFPLSLLHEL